MEVKNNKFDVKPCGVEVSEAVQLFPVCLCARGEMYVSVCSTVFFYFRTLIPSSLSIPWVLGCCLVLVPLGFLLRPRSQPVLGSSACPLPSPFDRAGTSSTPIPSPILPPPPPRSHACATPPPWPVARSLEYPCLRGLFTVLRFTVQFTSFRRHVLLFEGG